MEAGLLKDMAIGNIDQAKRMVAINHFAIGARHLAKAIEQLQQIDQLIDRKHKDIEA